MERNETQLPEPTRTSNTSPEVLEKSQKPVVNVLDDDLDNDFKHSREHILNTMEEIKRVVDISVTIATETGEPRAIEVANQSLKNLLDASKRLMENHEKRVAMKTQQEKINLGINDAETKNVTNQQFVFHGTTNDLMELIEKSKKDNSKIIDHE